MSREIKFRAWDKETEQYFKVLAIDFESKIVSCRCFKWKYGPSNPINLDDLALEQFTGLKDKNGKDIYEGDILAWHSNIYRKHDWVGLVLYRGAGFAVQESDKSYSSPEWLDCACRKDANIIEVIGNIHENPELLEADK